MESKVINNGRVIKQERGFYKVKGEFGIRTAVVSGKFRYNIKNKLDYPTVGDYVNIIINDEHSDCIINKVFKRKSLIKRKDPSGNEEQSVASNIDYVFFCMSLNDDFNLRRAERYITIGWDSGATPIILLTKSDLCADIDEKISSLEEIAIGIEILKVSSINNNIEELIPYIRPGKTIAFIGSSGVGKTTLINTILGGANLKTKDIGKNDKGKHTTTNRQLFEFDNGCCIIDTPGMRELGLVDNLTGIESTFEDIEYLTSQCKFKNCSHENEVGCAVKKAIEDGNLSIQRYNSYLKLKKESLYNLNSAEYLESKRDKYKNIAKNKKKLRR